ncbi:hotdog family protein [Taibaiella koreensis]|uniref:3-hydroxyacyl-ACP dehydratase n=1 Tax=Taibaiella koreensis TaxID=1268548 RepID=UPI000E59D5A5|nr:3-hydroxyacyl-ACP dehydratase [Taibaiella koreensis]
MILQNSFYTIATQTAAVQQLQAAIHIDPEHDIFRGHFPGQPVVPGVCMVQIVKELLEQQTGTKLLFRKGHQLKFLQLLVPSRSEEIQVNLSWKEEEGQFPCSADFKKNGETVFKLSGLFLPMA